MSVFSDKIDTYLLDASVGGGTSTAADASESSDDFATSDNFIEDDDTRIAKQVDDVADMSTEASSDSGDDSDDTADDILGGDDESEEVFDDTSDFPQVAARVYNKEIIVVKPENRQTSTVMNHFEMTDSVSTRAAQIANHNNCMVDIAGLDDPIKMAKRELMMRMSPLTLRRHVGDIKNAEGVIDQYYEFFSPNEMIFSTTYPDVL